MKKICLSLMFVPCVVFSKEPLTKFDSNIFYECRVKSTQATLLLNRALHMNKTMEQYIPLIADNEYPEDQVLELAQLGEHFLNHDEIKLNNDSQVNHLSDMLQGVCYARDVQ